MFRPSICAALTARCDVHTEHKLVSVGKCTCAALTGWTVRTGQRERQHVAGVLQAQPTQPDVTSHADAVKPRNSAERSRDAERAVSKTPACRDVTNCRHSGDTDWTVRGSTAGRQTGCVAHTAACVMCRDFCPGVKRPGLEADYCPYLTPLYLCCPQQLSGLQ
jgi:hypothetical protein